MTVEEADAVLAVLDASGAAYLARKNNPRVYNIIPELEKALA
jgi:hypothetical protein